MAATDGNGADGRLRSVLALATVVAGLSAYVYVLGGLVSWVRLGAGRLPADTVTTLVSPTLLLAIGLRALLVAALLLFVISALAYLLSRLRWGAQTDKWHKHLRRPPQAGRLNDAEVRAVAGINVLALSLVLGLGAASLLNGVLATGWVTFVFVIVWVGASVVFALVSASLVDSAWVPWVAGVLAVGALFAEFPVALLALIALAVAAFSRVIARVDRPTSAHGFLHSPLPWALAGVYMLVTLAFVATPPVSYPRAVVETSTGMRVGGYLARTTDGVYLATCTANQTRNQSADERVVLVSSSDVRSLTLGGEPYRLDSGDRPSLLAVMLRPFGVNVDLPVMRIELREVAPLCDSSEQAAAGPDQGLGTGVLPGTGALPAAAPDGEPTVAHTTTPALAQLALRYQPTVETTVADRFWPVAVGTVLNERSATGARTCLVVAGRCQRASLAALKPSGSAGDYLDLPESLASDPTKQFLAYERGVGVDEADARQWLTNPAAINPWASSAVYFYYAGKVPKSAPYASLPPGLIGLQYWFYYPYNYYPTVLQRGIMLATPLAAVKLSTDLHEGDWEHVTVLLDATTHQPRYLYLARHDTEGVVLPWNSSSLSFDGTHPIVQAAIGGHPSYDNHCGERPRARLSGQSADWVVCATGRYAFRAETTPLVDLARASWACWPGHFGEAKASELVNAKLSDLDPRLWSAKVVRVAGPLSPLRQVDNAGVCKRGPLAAEQTTPIVG